MQYMLIIYDNDKAWEKLSEGDRGALMKRYGTFTQDLQKSGHMKGGSALKPARTAVTVQNRSNATNKKNGTAVESHEKVSGFYLIDAKDLDEACMIAAKIPSADIGSVEVREVQPM